MVSISVKRQVGLGGSFSGRHGRSFPADGLATGRATQPDFASHAAKMQGIKWLAKSPWWERSWLATRGAAKYCI
ncbi:MAG: hypothetical protein DKINENOH_01671 [bacterium]|nr:hypothetical protein [bacterium]